MQASVELRGGLGCSHPAPMRELTIAERVNGFPPVWLAFSFAWKAQSAEHRAMVRRFGNGRPMIRMRTVRHNHGITS